MISWSENPGVAVLFGGSWKLKTFPCVYVCVYIYTCNQMIRQKERMAGLFLHRGCFKKYLLLQSRFAPRVTSNLAPSGFRCLDAPFYNRVVLRNSSFHLLSVHGGVLFSLFFRSPPLANPNLKNAESSAAALPLLTRLILRVPINQRGEKLKWFTATSSILPAAAARHSSPPGSLSLIPPALRFTSPPCPTHPTAAVWQGASGAAQVRRGQRRRTCG